MRTTVPSRPPYHGHSQRPRPNSGARGYGAAWRKLRAWYLAQHPLCVHCMARDRTTPATHVDHITPRARGGTDDEANLQALCASCHGRKTATYDGGYGT